MILLAIWIWQAAPAQVPAGAPSPRPSGVGYSPAITL
jgi:hypothetical protein